MRQPMKQSLPITALMAALLAPLPAIAATVRAPSPAALYVRARTAEINGNPRAASEGFSALLAREPTNVLLGQRAYSQALSSGDLPLALRAARLLDKQSVLRPDGRLLLVVDSVRTGNWAAARADIDKVEQDRLFSFLVPMLRAWIALGAHDGDPLALIEKAKTAAIGQPYYGEQRALLLIAMGRREEGISALRAASINRPLPTRLRLIAAQALASEGQKDRALALLDGDEPTLAAARALINAGKRLPAPVDSPSSGIAALFARVASDFGQQQLAPVGLVLARYATFLAPQDASSWLVTADLLGTMRRLDGALDALSHIGNDDPLAGTAFAVRVALLSQLGDREAALVEALKAAKAPGAGTAAWSRVGDVYLALSKPADAAKAYSQAIALAEAANAPGETLWPLWLQQGGALDLAGDWAGSKVAMQKALAIAPNQAMVLNQLGYSQIAHRENVADASSLIEQASKLRPDDPAITDSLGWVYYLRGNVAGAVPLLEKAAASDPTEPTINEHLGDAYWASGRLLEARYAWRAALVTAEDKDKARLSTKIDVGLSEATASP
jgi:tetratricopeptide (TPR) repeat protein